MPREIEYAVWLAPGPLTMVVRLRTERGLLVSYAVVLMTIESEVACTVRVYDNAHGRHEVHRYTRHEGKQLGELFHSGSTAEAATAAQRAVKEGWYEMMNAWRR